MPKQVPANRYLKCASRGKHAYACKRMHTQAYTCIYNINAETYTETYIETYIQRHTQRDVHAETYVCLAGRENSP